MASHSGWRAELDTTWDVLGPFPIHAREQYFLSPAFPLNLSQPIDYHQDWPSAYADGGTVNWSKAIGTRDGDIEVSFPQIRWKSLRATEGWAALQHHAVLRTTLTVYPPTSLRHNDIPHLLVDLKQGSYFTLKAKSQVSDFVPQWFAGNIYDLDHPLPQAVPLPVPPSLTGNPTEYDLFISGDYEIRLFGDPLAHNSELPVQKLGVRIQIQEPFPFIIHQKSQDVVSDFINGYAFGNVFGVGIQSLKGWWTVESIELRTLVTGMVVELQADQTVIAPLQTRIVPVFIHQSTPFPGEILDLGLSLKSGGLSEKIIISLPIIHHQLLSYKRQRVKGTFLFAGSSPTAFLAIPPELNNWHQRPPILALHGAGVDVLGQTFWEKSLPESKSTWTVIPTGRTSWGLDWHGPSTQDVWLALEELSTIIRERIPDLPKSWMIPKNSKVILIGHSNGGQGVWHIAARFPDRVLAAVPAAAYIKSQAYIPFTLSRSGHFIDPALRSILESSLTPDDNDLHVSNLVDTPILAIHGADDENVPVWHSRELVASYKAWHSARNITFLEDSGGGHWYPSILKRPEVEDFIERVLSSSGEPKVLTDAFTLTVANPQECGSLNGWKIYRLLIPGRLARLHVHKINQIRFDVEPSNVHTFSIPDRSTPYEIYIDDQRLSVCRFQGEIHISRDKSGTWRVADPAATSHPQPPARIQSILNTPGRIVIIISEISPSTKHELAAAQRLAHVLQLYHKIDTEVIIEAVAQAQIKDGSPWPVGNVVFIGRPSSLLAKGILGRKSTPVHIIDDIVRIDQRRFSRSDQAVIFSHPHPTRGPSGSHMVFLLYNSISGLERALRLFPFRTGVAVPDWLVVGDKMDNFGAGGIEAAGVWGMDWKLSDAMTWC